MTNRRQACRLWQWSAAFLLAFIAVGGPAPRYAEAQSTAPRVESVSFAGGPARGDTYELGEKVEVTVRFNRPVEWSEGRTELALTVGDHTRYARAHSISFNDRDLRFFYVVRADDRDADGISVPVNALSLDDGVIADRSGTTYTDIANDSVPAGAGRKVDGSRGTAPRIIDMIYHGPSRGRTYRRDDRIVAGVGFDRAVSVTGVPRMALTIGAETRWANYLPNHQLTYLDPQTSILFCYTVRPDDRDRQGLSIPADALSLNGGAITLAGDAGVEVDLASRAVRTPYMVDGRPSAVDGLIRGAKRVRNRAAEAGAGILSNFVRAGWREYPVDPDPCPQE